MIGDARVGRHEVPRGSRIASHFTFGSMCRPVTRDQVRTRFLAHFATTGANVVTDTVTLTLAMETGDPRDILRLRRCPQCAYDLAGLPRRHRCPECGFEYDPSMFAVYGWTGKERLSVAGRLLMGTWAERLLAILIFIVLACGVGWDVYKFCKTGSVEISLSFWFFIIVIVGTARLRSHVRRSREERWGTIQLLFTNAGASKRRGPGEPRFVPWERFWRLRFRKLRSIAGGKRLWRLRLAVPFFRWFGWEPFEALIECTPREAALVRRTIRRRWRAARVAAGRELSA